MVSIPEPEKGGTPSDESNDEQLVLAREQGLAYGRAVAELAAAAAFEGSQIEAGDLLVTYAIGEAEGRYAWEDQRLVWQETTDENAHIAVIVRDAVDGRFIPGLDVSVTLTTADGEGIGTHQHPFLWHPWLHHYGRDWALPASGSYGLAIHVAPAPFMRHDRENGQRFSHAVDVEWPAVSIALRQRED